MSEEIIQKEEEKEQKTEENKKDGIKFIIQIIFMIVGVMNITCANVLKEKLPFIIGFASILTSVMSFIKNMKEKEYKVLDTMKIPANIVAFILGVIILIKGQNAIPFIAIVWGISGLRKGVKGFNVAIFNKVHNKKWILEFIHATLETFFSILLVFDPFEKIEEHLVLVGIEMVISSLKIAFKDKAYEEIED